MYKYSDLREKIQLLTKNDTGGNYPASFTHYLQATDQYSKKTFGEPIAEYIYGINGFDQHRKKPVEQLKFKIEWDIPFPPPEKPKFTFIDLFAGIGGFRLAFQKLDGRCVFSSEWDSFAQKTYELNFGEVPFGDITKIDEVFIPNHDVLLAGFPCQPFSIAGVSKKNALGRKHGFSDETQGTLFFDIARIIEAKRPKAFLLENVKNLRSHDKGNTFRVIEKTLKELGYSVTSKVLDSKFIVPQHRERIFIVGYDKCIYGERPNFEFPVFDNEPPPLLSILEENVDEKYTLTDHLWGYLQNYARKHQEKGNGFGFGLADPNGISRTLSARYHKDGSEILISQVGKNPRRLTPRECARLQGYPDTFKINVSDTQAYRQFGNSVTMPLVEKVGKNIINTLIGKD